MPISRKRKSSDVLELVSKRRQRTRIELSAAADPDPVTVKPAYTNWEPPSIKIFTIQHFTSSKDEQVQLDVLLDKTLAYMVYKNVITDTKQENRFKGSLRQWTVHSIHR